MKKRVGFVGLGLMGRPMAKHLLTAGFDLAVYDVNKDAVAELVKLGANSAGSSKEVGQESDVVMTMLPVCPYYPFLEEEMMGPEGIVEGLKPGGIVMDGGNTSPVVTKKFAKLLLERNIEMLDTAVSGGVQGAIAGTLSAMIGGKTEVLDQCRDILSAFTAKMVHMGGNGMGHTTKLVNNFIVYGSIAMVSEALSLGAKAGVDPQAMHDAISTGAAGSWVMSNYFPQILDGEFEEGPSLSSAIVQLKYAKDLADDMDFPCFFPSVFQEAYKVAQSMGIGEGLHEYAVVQLWEKLGNLKLRKNT